MVVNPPPSRVVAPLEQRVVIDLERGTSFAYGGSLDGCVIG